jgi:glycosyltransferase involved in cell wall biosynthesis
MANETAAGIGRLPIVDVHPPASEPGGEVEVTFVMPCLNEAETLAGCVKAARRCIEENRLSAEIIVADNGSTDGSQALARAEGARVVDVSLKGYGNALQGGFAAARGRYLIMGDSDMSYDFGDAMKFVAKLREGYEMVMGSRFKGRIMPGAMPPAHQYFGNPGLSWLGRTLFQSRFSDFYCGLRGFSKEAYRRMNAKSPGMEFALELVVKSQVLGMRSTEVPITLHPDGRSRPPHLRTFRDGWRSLRFMLGMSPRWTLFMPGLVLVALGLIVGGLVAYGPVFIGGVGFDVHTLVAASLAVILGWMWITTAVAMRFYALKDEIGEPAGLTKAMFGWFNLERGLIVGGVTLLSGLAVILWLLYGWAKVDFGTLDVSRTLRPMIVGATLVAVGFQTVMASVMCSMLTIARGGPRRG